MSGLTGKGRSRWSFVLRSSLSAERMHESLRSSPVAPRSYIAGRASERRVELRGRDGRALVEDTRMRRGGGTGSRDG
ncbi:hypothetical protein K0M31_002830 [Melipona bicolor]|uniref:Uncharacterized protein n=1 Tax=Melipona bicolor TaxID=60889 RepID=A0AA40FZQ9_9HYME|nr:hypothetical protein K0M31_002830 [Melipona bicolor]